MLKLIILYLLSFGTTWVGLCSIMFAISHWNYSGALMPMLVGIIILLIGIRLLLATIRIFIPPKNKRIPGMVNYSE